MRFRSRIDAWLLTLLLFGILGMAYALVVTLLSDTTGNEKTIVVATTVPGILLIVSILLRTHYTVSDGKLRIVCGPFFKTISIVEITDITETHSPLSSPALSLDRLKITYGNNRRIMISPEDKKGFLRAIGKLSTD